MAAEHARDEDDFAQWYRQEMGVDLGELAAPDDAFGRPVTESLFANAASHSGPPAAAGPATRAPAACSPPSRPELASPPTRHADSDSPGSAQGAGAHRAESRPAAARLERGKSPLRRLSDMSISGAKQLQRSLSRQKDRISRGLNTLREPEPGARPVRAAPMGALGCQYLTTLEQVVAAQGDAAGWGPVPSPDARRVLVLVAPAMRTVERAGTPQCTEHTVRAVRKILADVASCLQARCPDAHIVADGGLLDHARREGARTVAPALPSRAVARPRSGSGLRGMLASIGSAGPRSADIGTAGSSSNCREALCEHVTAVFGSALLTFAANTRCVDDSHAAAATVPLPTLEAVHSVARSVTGWLRASEDNVVLLLAPAARHLAALATACLLSLQCQCLSSGRIQCAEDGGDDHGGSVFATDGAGGDNAKREDDAAAACADPAGSAARDDPADSAVREKRAAAAASGQARTSGPVRAVWRPGPTPTRSRAAPIAATVPSSLTRIAVQWAHAVGLAVCCAPSPPPGPAAPTAAPAPAAVHQRPELAALQLLAMRFCESVATT